MNPYYQDDAVTIYHGDCREVLNDLEPLSTHLLLTDPPYGSSYQSNRGNRHHGNPLLVADDGTLDVLAALTQALRRLRLYRHFYVFGPWDLTGLTLGATAELIWDKGGGTGMGDLSLPWRTSHERVTFGVWNPYPSMRGCGSSSARLRRGSVLRVNSTNAGQGAKRHPTEKPVMLLRQLIEASSLFDETVLDPFMGAGSTLEAARAEGRKAIGVEVEERYCEIAARRMGQEVLAL